MLASLTPEEFTALRREMQTCSLTNLAWLESVFTEMGARGLSADVVTGWIVARCLMGQPVQVQV